MKAAGLHEGDVGGGRVEQRFAIAGLFVALAAALAAPALFHAAERASDLPAEVALVVLASVIALGLMAAGFALGRRSEAAASALGGEARAHATRRRLWNEQLAREVSRSAKAKMPLALLRVDVDRGPSKPDGQAAAREAALTLLADVLGVTCRARDLVMPLGTDGFAVLLPRTTLTEARVAAERIRASVLQRRGALGAPLADTVTVSIGVSDLASLEHAHPHLLFSAADRALLVAKQAGRDRVEIGNGRVPPRTSSTVIVLDPRRRSRRRNTHHRSSP